MIALSKKQIIDIITETNKDELINNIKKLDTRNKLSEEEYEKLKNKKWENYFITHIKSLSKKNIKNFTQSKEDKSAILLKLICQFLYKIKCDTIIKTLEKKRYRKSQINALETIFENKFKSSCINMIMGSGKTLIIMTLIYYYYTFFNNKNKSILLISSRLNILNDMLEKINNKIYLEYGLCFDNLNIIDYVNKKKSSYKLSETKNNLIICNQQFLNKIDPDIKDSINLIISDECHNITAKSYTNFLEENKKLGKKMIGLSATPIRSSKKTAKELLNDYFEKIIYKYDIFEGIIDDIIVPPRIIYYKYKKDDDILIKLLKIELELIPFRKIIGFCKDKNSLNKWKSFFEKNSDLKIYITHSQFKDGDKNYMEFKNLKSIDDNKINAILLSINQISEGCDIPDADMGIFLDNVKDRDPVKHFQSIGRILRTDKNNKKKFGKILCAYEEYNNNNLCNMIINYYKTLTQLSSDKNTLSSKTLELFKKTIRIDDHNIKIEVDNTPDHDCHLTIDEKITIEDWKNIKLALEKKIRNDIDKDEEDIEYNEKLGDIFISSSIQKYILNGKMHDEILSWKSCIVNIYKIIGEYEKIKKNTCLNITDDIKEEIGYNYHEDLKMSIQGFNANGGMKEVYRQCTNNDINCEINVKLKNEKNLNIKIIDKKLYVDHLL